VSPVIDKLRARFGVERLCRVLGVPASTYYARRSRPASARAQADAELLERIGRIRVGHAACYGAWRTWQALGRDGVQVARCTVERVMRDNGLVGVLRGQRARTTVADEAAVRPPDLVDRKFVADRPDALWLADITYVSTWQGFLYVAFVLDVFSRRIVGWQTAINLRTDLPLDALEMALWNRRVQSGQTIHHSDAGSQGGFNWSSQHLVIMEVFDGATTAAGGSGSAPGDAFAGPADASTACGARVLASDRAGQANRGGGA
jgi:putative transposase